MPAARVGSDQIATCNLQRAKRATCNLQRKTNAKLQLHQVQICKSSGLQPQLYATRLDCGAKDNPLKPVAWQLWPRCQLEYVLRFTHSRVEISFSFAALTGRHRIALDQSEKERETGENTARRMYRGALQASSIEK